MAKVIPIKPAWRPKTYTSSEAMIEEMRVLIHGVGIPQRELAAKVGVSASTINNLASGKTRWPRPTTLFPLLQSLGKAIQIVDR